MKKKLVVMMISLLVIVLIILLGSYILYKIIFNELTDNIKLEPENYLTSVEIKSKSNFMLFINKEKKISNIIFLNGYGIKSLYKKKIENKSINKGIEIIVNSLKNNNEFDGNEQFKLINYGDNAIFDKIKIEFNKQFVIYGIDKYILSDKSTLELKLDNLDVTNIKQRDQQLKKLYDISINLISVYRNNENEYSKMKEEAISLYANNLYSKLVNYANNITYQEKNSSKGIDITTINATDDYNNELYATGDSWYYIENGLVYAYINFKYNNKSYSYCYKGSSTHTKGLC